MLCSFTTSVYAIDGCDGVLDAGEIELESYIEWNTFKSSVDGISSEAMEELRSAEERGNLPEMYPIGESKVLIKTDIGFYLFKANTDGSYESMDILHFNHLKDSSNNHIYTGTGTIYDGSTKSSSYSDTGKCCWFGGLLSYGYYGDNFYIVGKYMGNDTDLHDDEVYNTTKGAGYVATGYIVYKIDTDPSSVIQDAMHSYSSYGGSASIRCYWGNTSFFVLAERQSEKNGNDETISIQEYDFSVGKVSDTFTDFTVVASAKVNGSTSLASRSGRFATSSNTSINLEKSRIYPYAQLKIGVANLREDYMSFGTHYGVYSLKDNGKRTAKPFAGFISLGDKLYNTRDYYNSRGDSNAIYNALGQTLPVGSSSLSIDQISTFNEKLKIQCNENGIPFYGVVNRSTSYSSMDTTTIYSSRLKRKGADGKYYYDGQLVLNRTVKPQLGSDGKYILGQTTTMYVGGGLNKNSSKLTFKNISLGSDATIEIYGITDTGAQNLLETITNAKNSVGTYTTGQYNYGYLKIVFNGGTSTSGRGEGFILSDVKYGQFGVADYDYKFVDAPQISAPTFDTGTLGEALIPCGDTINHTTTVSLDADGEEYRNTALLKENVFVEKGRTIKYTNSRLTGTDSRYTPWYWNAYISIVDPNDSNIRQNMTVTNSSQSATTYSSAVTLETGYYDIYGYVGTYSDWYAEWDVTISGTERQIVSSNKNTSENISSKKYDTSRFDIKKQVIVNKSKFSSINTTGSIKIISDLDLDKGDTVVIHRNTNNTNLNNATGLSFYSVGTTSSIGCYSTTAYIKDSNGTGMAYWINSDTNVDLYFIHSNYSSTAYQISETDSFTITVYKPRYIKDFVYNQSNLNSTTSYVYIPNETFSGNYGYMYDLTIVRGGVTSTNGYRLYLGGNIYYMYNSGTTKGILDGATVGIGSCVGSTSYTQIDSSTKATIKMYETAFREFMPTVFSENKRISTTAPTKSGYTPVSAVIELTLPKTSNGDYTMYAATKQSPGSSEQSTVFSETTVTSSADIIKTITLRKADLGKDIVLYSRANQNKNYTYLEVDKPFKYKITWYYADDAGTELNRYAPTSNKNIVHKVGSMEDEFVKVKVTELNIPDGMVMYVNGTQVTSAPYETGWLTTNYINMQLSIPGDSTYGKYKINSLDDVCKYELLTKDLADATSKQSFTNVNLGELKPTSTYNSNTGRYTYGLERSDAVITGVKGGYIQIVSTLETPNYGSYDSEVPITGTVTGLRGLSSINSALENEWDTCEIGTTDWLQPTQDTVTISCTASGTSYNSTYYCPSGYTVKDYYRITASNIPDSKIKTYQSGMVNVVFDEEITLGEKFSQEALDNGYSSVLTYTNVPKTKTNGLSSSHRYYSTSNYGALYYTYRDGTVRHETGSYYRALNPSTFKSMKFTPTRSGTGTYGEAPTIYTGTYVIYNSYQLDDILGNGYDGISLGMLNSAMPLVRICGARNPNTPKNVALTSDTNYSMIESIENNALKTGKKSGDTMSIMDWAGKNEFDDGRYGVAKMGYELWYSNKDYYTVGRIDVYREYTDGTVRNIAMVPVTATDTFFDQTGGINGNMEEAPPVYHKGNDLMYIASKEIDSGTDGNAGASLAWLRTGHWHLKGNPGDIEGIVIGGVQNKTKSMNDDNEADTDVIVPELDMDAESWMLGHTIRDGRVTEEKLSEDVQEKINELNLGTITLVRNNGAQSKLIPVRNAFKNTGNGTAVLQDCTLKYGSYEMYMFAYDTDQIFVGIDTQVIGDKNSGGSVSSKLSAGSYIFKGTTTCGNDEINIVLQVNVIDVPDKDTETTLTFN